MFFRQINEDLKLGLSIPLYADELFALTDRNRAFLKQWLPWLDGVKRPADTREFLESQLAGFQRGDMLHVTIFYQGGIAGVLGYNRIDPANSTGHIGYWLGREYNGRGIMRQSVRDLISLGREYYALDRMEIRCAVQNLQSRAIPEDLGFKAEGIIRRAENLYGRFVDHVVYGLLKDD